MKLYIDMIKIVNDIYKETNDYDNTLKIIRKYNKDDENMIREFTKILDYIIKLYGLYENKIKSIKGDIIIKRGIDNSFEELIEIYKKIYNDFNINIEILLLIIIPSISIKTKNGIEIIDFKIREPINDVIINLDIKEDVCSICFEPFSNSFIISNCCCNMNCFRCFHLLDGKCAICKKQNPILIKTETSYRNTRESS
jgi:hypothetical protein